MSILQQEAIQRASQSASLILLLLAGLHFLCLTQMQPAPTNPPAEAEKPADEEAKPLAEPGAPAVPPIVYGGHLGAGVLFLGLAILARWQARVALAAGLAVYLTLMTLVLVTAPRFEFLGLLLRLPGIVLLLKGIVTVAKAELGIITPPGA